MKTIYSIIYVTLNATLNEKVSIGLVMSNNEEFLFNYSFDKLKALRSLLSVEQYYIVREYLKALDKQTNSNNDSELFHKDFQKQFNREWMGEKYLSYLHSYSHNIIQVSQPKNIDISLNQENFKRIFEKYIYKVYKNEQRVKENTKEQLDTQVKTNLYPKIDKKVNFNRLITSSDIHNLLTSIQVNFIGVNGKPMVGQILDFNKNDYYLENDISRYISLTKALDLVEKTSGKYFVIGQEPISSEKKNHNIWKQVRESNFLDFVDIGEVQKIQEYVIDNDVRPYFAIDE